MTKIWKKKRWVICKDLLGLIRHPARIISFVFETLWMPVHFPGRMSALPVSQWEWISFFSKPTPVQAGPAPGLSVASLNSFYLGSHGVALFLNSVSAGIVDKNSVSCSIPLERSMSERFPWFREATGLCLLWAVLRIGLHHSNPFLLLIKKQSNSLLKWNLNNTVEIDSCSLSI